MVTLLEYYNDNNPIFADSNAQHTFMAHNHVENIANAVRKYDNNRQTLNHYMSFGWEGLSEIGKVTNPPLITQSEIDNFYNLAALPLYNDEYETPCD